MNSLSPLEMENTKTRGEARPASTWLERFVLPIAISIMEAQPLALIIGVLSLMFTRPLADIPLVGGEIALLEAGLLWWAMIVENRSHPHATRHRAARLHLIGWLIALAITVGPLLPSLLEAEAIFPAFVAIAVVTWLWRRAMYYAQIGFQYGTLSASFKGGFGVLLAVLLLIVAFPSLPALRNALAFALPVFFLGGLVTLSLARLGMIRNSHRTLAGSQADPTRSWLVALVLFGGSLTVFVILLESIFSLSSFEMILNALTPIWNALGTLLSWILYGIVFFILAPIYDLLSWLLSPILHSRAGAHPPQKLTLPRPPSQSPGHTLTIPPVVFTIGRWVLVFLALLVLLLVVRAAIRHWFNSMEREEIEEEREGLDARSLLSERWKEWWSRWRLRTQSGESMASESLDPTSARARYREFLQAIASTKESLARKPTETPHEYERRLLTYLKSEADSIGHVNHVSDEQRDSLLLDQLTHAYIQERYAGRPTDERQRVQMHTWVAHLIVQLTLKTRDEKTAHRSSS
jgi:hypothetical protein